MDEVRILLRSGSTGEDMDVPVGFQLQIRPNRWSAIDFQGVTDESMIDFLQVISI